MSTDTSGVVDAMATAMKDSEVAAAVNLAITSVTAYGLNESPAASIVWAQMQTWIGSVSNVATLQEVRVHLGRIVTDMDILERSGSNGEGPCVHELFDRYEKDLDGSQNDGIFLSWYWVHLEQIRLAYWAVTADGIDGWDADIEHEFRLRGVRALVDAATDTAQAIQSTLQTHGHLPIP